jgi:hypothetical protein
VTTKHPLPPLRDLPAGRLAARKGHLLAEIAREEAPKQASLRRFLPSARSIRGRRAAPVLAATLAAAVVALLLVSPWEGSPSLTERARAAIGDAPVLHVVTEQPGAQFGPLIDIETGKAVPQTRQSEVWFDEGRALKKSIERLDGVVLDETLETQQGGFTPGGPLITCAWIAAHPIEATKLRVSCNENMQNGTTPRHVPEAPPTLDARLAGFVDHYRAALGSGRAREIGRDTVDGRSVVWLRFTWPTRGPGGTPQSNAQDVAVDASTYKPVRLRSADGTWNADVTVAETLPYNASFFRRPEQAPPSPSSGRTKEQTPIALSQASAVLGRAPLWLGEEWRGLRLVEVTELELVTGYGPLAGLEPTFSKALRLTYAAEDGSRDDGPRVVISEATRCEMGLLWPCGRHVAREGHLQTWFLGAALARISGLYVTIQSTAPGVDPLTPGIDPLTIARSLEPARP